MVEWEEQVIYPSLYNGRPSAKPSIGTTLCILRINKHDVAHVAGNDDNGWTVSLRQMKPLSLYPVKRVKTKSEAVAFVHALFHIVENQNGVG